MSYRPEKFKAKDGTYGPDTGGWLLDTFWYERGAAGNPRGIIRWPTFEEVRWVLPNGTLTLKVMHVPISMVVGFEGEECLIYPTVSAREQRAICAEMGWLPLSEGVVRLLTKLGADVGAVLKFEGLVRTPADSYHMKSLAFSRALSENVAEELQKYEVAGKDPGKHNRVFVGGWKWWILSRRQALSINMGACKTTKPTVTWWQEPGGMHDVDHYDYSQLMQVMEREATWWDRLEDITSTVDLVDSWNDIVQVEPLPEGPLDWYRKVPRIG